MLWQDFLIDRALDDKTLTTVLATILPVDPEHMHVTHTPADVLNIDDPLAKLVCETSPVGGEFVQGLQLYVLDDALQRWVECCDNLALIGRFCEVAGCSALVDDGSVNPFAWLLVRDTNEMQAVLIDSRRLDQDEYIVVADIPIDAMTGT